MHLLMSFNISMCKNSNRRWFKPVVFLQKAQAENLSLHAWVWTALLLASTVPGRVIYKGTRLYRAPANARFQVANKWEHEY